MVAMTSPSVPLIASTLLVDWTKVGLTMKVCVPGPLFVLSKSAGQLQRFH